MRAAGALVGAIGAVAIVAIAAAACAQSPPAPPASPAASPGAASSLPQIGRTRATAPFCAMVRDDVAPAVLDLMTVDELLGAGRVTYRRMAVDVGAAQDLDRVRLGKTVVGMARDLAIVRDLVNDEKRFRHVADAENDRLALRLRAQLRAVADRQEAALNMVNGVLETDLLKQMMGSLPRVQRLGISRSFYHAVADALGEQQTKIANAEAELAPTVVAAAVACGVTQPLSSPDPAKQP